MLSQTVEYALRAVVHLADESPDARTTQQISEATQVPKPYLSKVLQSLCRSGIVRSQAGIGGGMSLARSPDDLTILEVVNAVDPIVRIETCPLGLKTHGRRLCPLHRRLDNALAMLQESFGTTTLSQLMNQPDSPHPLCDIPAEVLEKNDEPPRPRGRSR
ncbi:MAG: Rrf2 family transcriptional regulator [Planctomycetales bacterium]